MSDYAGFEDFTVWVDFAVTARKVFHDFFPSILQLAIVVADHFRIARRPAFTMSNTPWSESAPRFSDSSFCGFHKFDSAVERHARRGSLTSALAD